MNSINILYTCDDAYIPLTSISMASVIYNNPKSYITFYIATENEDGENLNKLKDFYKDNKNIEIKYLDCRKYDYLLKEKDFDRWGSNSYYVYWKLFAYDELDCDYIWYLDSDVICLKKIENPSTNKTIGAVIDSAHACFNKLAGIPGNYYFYNTGALYIDINKWKINSCINKVANYIESMTQKPLMCDMDILSDALQNDMEVINPKYNYFAGYDYYGIHNSFEMYSLNKKSFYSEKDFEGVRENAIFYHCLGGVFGRPWEKDNESPIQKEFNKFREVSAWPNYEKEANNTLLFKVEKFLEILPDSMYNKIHNFSMKSYLKKLEKNR